ncbi:hypothetical protein S58_61470 [Bradyrhizobium oligotrophicum S58]|uniref:Uncharacterized protein n=2 Tax=Bradyrhizobium oligotrophicum TaxID=44255 RepID=M4ZE66_9BRAD|nr:hypothetical protein S58_61470 [Bradyrhizobium oligotrophicum S58]
MGKGFDFMYRWRRASVPNSLGLRGLASPLEAERPDERFQADAGFHDDATLTLSPRLTSVVAASIAAGTLSLGISATIAMMSIRALLSIPA